MRRKMLAKQYNIRPLAAREQDHRQLWDEQYTRAVLGSLQLDIRNFPDKIAYRIKNNISSNELLTISDHVQQEIVRIILTYDRSIYPDFRKMLGI